MQNLFIVVLFCLSLESINIGHSGPPRGSGRILPAPLRPVSYDWHWQAHETLIQVRRLRLCSILCPPGDALCFSLPPVKTKNNRAGVGGLARTNLFGYACPITANGLRRAGTAISAYCCWRRREDGMCAPEERRSVSCSAAGTGQTDPGKAVQPYIWCISIWPRTRGRIFGHATYRDSSVIACFLL
ncbi:hypothetical protein EDB81DRAFT_430716 [Dactylonectria macrodidyma]|uniref:Secreted protein n=1 Tax=Dactylonectria macrodidyma TaxID=307937 RepID=A0A9P9CXQ8_9HYPO|nr:hypothetical protein EDB81DRAFT_430716 [Dactylonectria macrodidyma]